MQSEQAPQYYLIKIQQNQDSNDSNQQHFQLLAQYDEQTIKKISNTFQVSPISNQNEIYSNSHQSSNDLDAACRDMNRYAYDFKNENGSNQSFLLRIKNNLSYLNTLSPQMQLQELRRAQKDLAQIKSISNEKELEISFIQKLIEKNQNAEFYRQDPSNTPSNEKFQEFNQDFDVQINQNDSQKKDLDFSQSNDSVQNLKYEENEISDQNQSQQVEDIEIQTKFDQNLIKSELQNSTQKFDDDFTEKENEKSFQNRKIDHNVESNINENSLIEEDEQNFNLCFDRIQIQIIEQTLQKFIKKDTENQNKEQIKINKSDQIKKYNKWESFEIGRLLYCLWELYENEPDSQLVDRLIQYKDERKMQYSSCSSNDGKFIPYHKILQLMFCMFENEGHLSNSEIKEQYYQKKRDMVYSKLQKNRIAISHMQDIIERHIDQQEFSYFEQKDFGKIYSILYMYQGIQCFSEQQIQLKEESFIYKLYQIDKCYKVERRLQQFKNFCTPKFLLPILSNEGEEGVQKLIFHSQLTQKMLYQIQKSIQNLEKFHQISMNKRNYKDITQKKIKLQDEENHLSIDKIQNKNQILQKQDAIEHNKKSQKYLEQTQKYEKQNEKYEKFIKENNNFEEIKQDDPDAIKKQFEIFKKKNFLLAKRQQQSNQINFFDDSFKLQKCEPEYYQNQKLFVQNNQKKHKIDNPSQNTNDDQSFKMKTYFKQFGQSSAIKNFNGNSLFDYKNMSSNFQKPNKPKLVDIMFKNNFLDEQSTSNQFQKNSLIDLQNQSNLRSSIAYNKFQKLNGKFSQNNYYKMFQKQKIHQPSQLFKGESINKSLFLKSPDGLLEKLNFSKMKENIVKPVVKKQAEDEQNKKNIFSFNLQNSLFYNDQEDSQEALYRQQLKSEDFIDNEQIKADNLSKHQVLNSSSVKNNQKLEDAKKM